MHKKNTEAILHSYNIFLKNHAHTHAHILKSVQPFWFFCYTAHRVNNIKLNQLIFTLAVQWMASTKLHRANKNTNIISKIKLGNSDDNNEDDKKIT